MFVNKPKLKVPKGAKERWQVRYRGGRKEFQTEAGAMQFADQQRRAENGWAEVTHTIEIVVSPR